jgi:uncharacterized protein YdaU (DUF1376 family)
MPGLSRFDFYPRDWHLDTRDLSNDAKGVYIDLLCAMYARGGPLPYDEHELCRLCGCATERSLRPLLEELIQKGKLRAADGLLVNRRALEELAKAERRQAIASEGGKAKAQSVQPEYEVNTNGTQVETRFNSSENQYDSVCCPSPSPSLEEFPPTEGVGPTPIDPKRPLFDIGRAVLGKSSGGQVTRLLQHFGGDIQTTLRTLQFAAGKSDPNEYVGAILRGERSSETDWNAFNRDLGVRL